MLVHASLFESAAHELRDCEDVLPESSCAGEMERAARPPAQLHRMPEPQCRKRAMTHEDRNGCGHMKTRIGTWMRRWTYSLRGSRGSASCRGSNGGRSRRTMGKIGQFCPKIVKLVTGTTAGNGTWWKLKVV